jgi:bla regulator protein BlaR1
MAYAVLTQLALVSATAVFIGFVTVIVKRLFAHRLSPAFHYFIWVIFAVRLILPFAPESSLSVGNLIVSAGEGILESWQYSRAQTAETAEGVKISETADAPEREYSQGGLNNALYGGAESKSSPFPQNAATVPVFIYFAGVIAGTINYAKKIRRYTKIIERTVKPAQERDTLLFEEVKRELGIKKEIKLFEGNESMLIGFAKPAVILAKNCPDADKRAILAHELLHYKNKDNFVNLALSVLKNFYWFNPLIHYFICGIKDDMEILCDARTIKKLNYRKKDYAMVLFNSSSDNDNESRAPLGATQMSAGGEELKTRISFISKFKKPGRIASVIVILIGFAMLFTTLTNPKRSEGGQTEFAEGETAEVSVAFAGNAEIAEEAGEIGVAGEENYELSYAFAEGVEVVETVNESGEVYEVYFNGDIAGNTDNSNKNFKVTIPKNQIKKTRDNIESVKIVFSEDDEATMIDENGESFEIILKEKVEEKIKEETAGNSGESFKIYIEGKN